MVELGRRFAALVVAVCACLVCVTSIARAEEPSGERCRRECERAKDERDAICRGLPTRKAREKCWRSSNELHAECVKKCKAGPQMIERQIDYTPEPGGPVTAITVRIEAPEPMGEDWSAVLEIVGFAEPYRKKHYGVDSMSAVLAAARTAPVMLASIAGPGTLTWLGDADLGFPFLPFGDEPDEEVTAT